MVILPSFFSKKIILKENEIKKWQIIHSERLRQLTMLEILKDEK